ncbi:MAG TPA: hypothetical protein VL325_00060 [Pyrinomonadaceae bacterium]|nr:hypothetical protein [Pyrinomonadaceae bacterium]
MQEKKVRDYQPPYQEEREGLSEQQLEGNPQGWTKEDIEEITDQASNRDADGVLRQALRGDETKGDPNERDVSGAPEHKDTAYGREETKQDKKGAANING